MNQLITREHVKWFIANHMVKTRTLREAVTEAMERPKVANVTFFPLRPHYHLCGCNNRIENGGRCIMCGGIIPVEGEIITGKAIERVRNILP